MKPFVIELDSNKEFKVFPNPAKEKLTFDFTELETKGDVNIEVVDVYGRVVLKLKTALKKQDINIKEWPIGLYVCKVEADNIITTKKIIKN